MKRGLENSAKAVLGVDISSNMIEIARDNVQDARAEFRVAEPDGDMQAFDPQSRFDAVTALEVLEYFDDSESFFDIVCANLVEEGYVAFDVINSLNAAAFLKNRILARSPEVPLKLHRLSQILKLCERKGLQVVSCDGVYLSLLPLSFAAKLGLSPSFCCAWDRLLSR